MILYILFNFSLRLSNQSLTVLCHIMNLEEYMPMIMQADLLHNSIYKRHIFAGTPFSVTTIAFLLC